MANLASVKQDMRALSAEELLELNLFVVNLIKAKRKVANLSAAINFSVGDKVRVADRVRPARYAGELAEVVSSRQTRVVIKFSNGEQLVIGASALSHQ